MSKHISSGLNNGRLLARNTVLNLVGNVAPILIAIFCIPMLIKEIGTDRFGVLTIAWMVIGYFSLFDLGLGRALTKLVAEKIGSETEHEIPGLVWTGLFLMLILGIVGAIVVSLLSPWIVKDILNIPENLRSETLSVFYLLGFSVPVVIITAGLRGILEAQQRFGIVNAIRIPMSIFSYLGPLFVVIFSNNLLIIIVVLVIGRIVGFLVHLFSCLHVMPALRYRIVFIWTSVKPLLRFGSWMTVTNIVGPVMVYLDRFLIGALVSMTAVTYYVTPYEVVTKLLIIPGAIVGVLFPAFSASFMQNPIRTVQLFNSGIKYIFLFLFPIILLVVTFAQEGLTLWLNEEFGRNSTKVLQMLSIGVFLNSLAQIPFTLLQGAGRPDVTAKLHLIELPFYLILVWWLIGSYGIEGAAMAWLIRIIIDTIFLFFLVRKLFPTSIPIVIRITIYYGFSLVTLLLMIFVTGLITKFFSIIFILVAFFWFVWYFVLEMEEKHLFNKYIGYIKSYFFGGN